MIGVLDFFAVLLPGAIATWLLTYYLPPDLSSALLPGDGTPGVARWIAFVLMSYALGHFVFMGGSKLDPAYDRWRKRTKPLAQDVAFQAAQKLRRQVTPTLSGGAFSTVNWARSYIGIHQPQARLEIDRIEANSKFFRGMVVISIMLAAHFLLARGDAVLAVGAIIACGLSFSRFCDQRWKMTELAYATAVIVYETRPDKAAAGAGEPPASARRSLHRA
ncbi:MAG: hypothetical protein ACRERC_16875 [Candidatus Binatia bacterium]